MCTPPKQNEEKKVRRPKDTTFTKNLIRLMEDYPNLIRFVYDQQASMATILITNPEYLEAVLENYFRHGRYTSFQRQLNNFGFTKLEKNSGPQNSVYRKLKGPQIMDLYEIATLRPIATRRRPPIKKSSALKKPSIIGMNQDTPLPAPIITEQFFKEDNISIASKQQSIKDNEDDDGRVENHWERLISPAVLERDSGEAPAAVPAPDLPLPIPPLVEAPVPFLPSAPIEANGFEPSVQYLEEQPTSLPSASSFFNITVPPTEPAEDLRMYPGAIVPGHIASLGPPSPVSENYHTFQSEKKRDRRTSTFTTEIKKKKKQKVVLPTTDNKKKYVKDDIIESPLFFQTISRETFQRMKRELFTILLENNKRKDVSSSIPSNKRIKFNISDENQLQNQQDHHLVMAPYLEDNSAFQHLFDDLGECVDVPDLFSSFSYQTKTTSDPFGCDFPTGNGSGSTGALFSEELLPISSW